jgi:hypothetical protein
LVYRGGYQTTFTDTDINLDAPNNYRTTTLEVQPYRGSCLVVGYPDAQRGYPSYRCTQERTGTATNSTNARLVINPPDIIDASGIFVRNEETNQITQSSKYISLGSVWQITNYNFSYIREERGDPPRLKRIGELRTTTDQIEACIIRYSSGGLIPRVYARGIVQSYTKDYRPRRTPQQIDSYEDVYLDFVLAEAYVMCDDGRFERFDFEPYAT